MDDHKLQNMESDAADQVFEGYGADANRLKDGMAATVSRRQSSDELKGSLTAAGSFLDCWEGPAPCAVLATSDGAELSWSVPSLSGGEIIRLAIRDGAEGWHRDTDSGSVPLSVSQARDFVFLIAHDLDDRTEASADDTKPQPIEVGQDCAGSCPVCGSDMVRRVNRQRGNSFFGCKDYPQCRGTRPTAEDQGRGTSSVRRSSGSFYEAYPAVLGGAYFGSNPEYELWKGDYDDLHWD